MSQDRHLARLLRLQRMHQLLMRRQAGQLAQAEAEAHRASARLARVQSLLHATGASVGSHAIGTLAGGAHLRVLLARTLAAEQQQVALAEDSRQRAARQQRIMDVRADGIGARINAARRLLEAGAQEPPGRGRDPTRALLSSEKGPT